jgi:hypothetical protein
MGHRADGFIEHNPAVVEDFLKLAGGLKALMRDQIGFPRARRRDIEQA